MSSIAFSRCFALHEEGLYFVPYADMFNHSTSQWHTRVRHDSEGVWMYAEEEIGQDDEVLNFYGNYSAIWMLVTHGFFEELPKSERGLLIDLGDSFADVDNIEEALDYCSEYQSPKKALIEKLLDLQESLRSPIADVSPQGRLLERARLYELETVDYWLSKLE